jgi:hypothetical protein
MNQDPSGDEPDTPPALPEPEEIINLDDDIAEELDRILGPDMDPEQVQPLETGRFGNDPRLESLVDAADVDNLTKERGTKAELLVWLRHAERLRIAMDEYCLTGGRFEQFGKRITGLGKSTIYKLQRLDQHAQPVLDRCASDRAVAIAKGKSYDYPTWNKALGWFTPKKPRPDEDVDHDDPDDLDAEHEEGMMGGAAVHTLETYAQTVDDMAAELTIATENLQATKKELEAALASPNPAQAEVLQQMTGEIQHVRSEWKNAEQQLEDALARIAALEAELGEARAIIAGIHEAPEPETTPAPEPTPEGKPAKKPAHKRSKPAKAAKVADKTAGTSDDLQ